MARAKRRLNATAVALSIVAHVVVLTTLAFHAPRLVRPQEVAGPPEPVIPILIAPRPPPAPPGAEKPPPIRLHRRKLRRDIPPPDIAPLIVPPRLAVPPARAVRARTPRVSVAPTPAERVAQALRSSAVGCANPDLLSPAERERCNERLGRGALQVPHLAPPVAPEIERAGAAREADRLYRYGPATAGPAGAGGGSGPGYHARPADAR